MFLNLYTLHLLSVLYLLVPYCWFEGKRAGLYFFNFDLVFFIALPPCLEGEPPLSPQNKSNPLVSFFFKFCRQNHEFCACLVMLIACLVIINFYLLPYLLLLFLTFILYILSLLLHVITTALLMPIIVHRRRPIQRNRFSCFLSFIMVRNRLL